MITTEQRQLRQKYIGSSDAPAILGVDPYRSAWDVWAEKTGLADGFEGNADTDRGNLLEPVLIQWAAQQLKGVVVPSQFVVRPDSPALCANLDAFLRPCDDAPGGAVIEAKTGTNADEWGEPGTDEVPDRVLIQTHHAMYLVGCRLAFVPVLLPVFGRFDFRLYKVERNDELADVVAERGTAFWREHVEPRVAPTPGSVPSLDVLNRIRRQPNKVVPIADELVDGWITRRSARLQAEKDEEAAKIQLLTALGDAEAGAYSRGRVEYMEIKRKGYTVEPSTYRALRIKPNRGELP